MPYDQNISISFYQEHLQNCFFLLLILKYNNLLNLFTYKNPLNKFNLFIYKNSILEVTGCVQILV